MDLEQEYLAAVDQLCTRDFPTEHIWTVADLSGPGYFMTGLGAAGRPEQQLTPDDIYAHEEAIALLLKARWGEASRWGTPMLTERTLRGDGIPEPWATVRDLAIDLCSWEAPGTGRWVTLAVVDRETENQLRLLLVVTETLPELSA
jgi:hypothetical protein